MGAIETAVYLVGVTVMLWASCATLDYLVCRFGRKRLRVVKVMKLGPVRVVTLTRGEYGRMIIVRSVRGTEWRHCITREKVSESLGREIDAALERSNK